MNFEPHGGVVQLICSPIGNLGDITYRAVECLKRADCIACEDTRHSRNLLNHYEICPRELISLHDHNESHKGAQLAERILQSGETLALISDAGSPSVSDPGFLLVRECISRNITVEVIPGPSSVITALVGSGLATDKFTFRGFLPVKSGKKEKILRVALESEETTIFFESPHRIKKTLAVIDELNPTRRICVARELTKKFETYHRGSARELLLEFGDSTVKGEITLVLDGLSRSNRKDEKLGEQ